MAKRLKIAVIAPIEPYRSGVAKHSTQVALELACRTELDVSVFSFKRLYPKILFPGNADRDDNTEPIGFNHLSFDLDSMNPLTWWRLVRHLKQHNFRLVIMPAWTFVVAPCFGWISRACRKHGIRVVTIVHNAFDHEQGRVKNAVMGYQINSCDDFICHNNSLKDQIVAERPAVNIATSPHPIFDQYPEASGELERRAPLELLFFGLIRKYKGLDILLAAVAKLNKSRFKLTIAGECWDDIDKYKQQVSELDLNKNVEFIDRYVADAEAAELMDRADAVVLPYRSITGTGVIPLAYHYQTPAITSNHEAFHEVVKSGSSGIIAEGGSAEQICAAVKRFEVVRGHVDMPAKTLEMSAQFTWKHFCDELTGLV